MTITKSDFGTTPDGNQITRFTVTNRTGNSVSLIDYGAIIVSVVVPDRDGNLENINLNFDSLEGYLARHAYLGSTVGRFCNRIAKGHFSLGGADYSLVINNGPNHLHGGTIGFDKLIWSAEEITTLAGEGIRFTTVSPDGQEGYPGTLSVAAEYVWNDANELTYTFRAKTDKATVINMTNHSYWNLSGCGSGRVLDHEVTMNCNSFLEVDESLIPTGNFLDVADTPLDFRTPARIGERINQLPATKGYDHCFVINGDAGVMRLAGKVLDSTTGRTMEVHTTQPGVQLYTGNHLTGKYEPYSGLCLETQHYPDSPNKPDFPTTQLDPGDTFEESTMHRFGVIS